MSKHLLLHVCCAPCATYPLEVLLRDWRVTAYFYNPNIHPESEYQARLEEARRYFAGRVELIEAEYADTLWHAAAKGLEQEPERGKRCRICYEMRLQHAAKYAKQNNFEAWTCVLTVSPHKDATAINAIGTSLAAELGIEYLATDWKKAGGFERGVELSRVANLRRQDYCGCVHSLRERTTRQQAKLDKQKIVSTSQK